MKIRSLLVAVLLLIFSDGKDLLALETGSQPMVIDDQILVCDPNFFGDGNCSAVGRQRGLLQKLDGDIFIGVFSEEGSKSVCSWFKKLPSLRELLEEFGKRNLAKVLILKKDQTPAKEIAGYEVLQSESSDQGPDLVQFKIAENRIHSIFRKYRKPFHYLGSDQFLIRTSSVAVGEDGEKYEVVFNSKTGKVEKANSFSLNGDMTAVICSNRIRF